MEITFVGAAREVTGSCHLLHVNGHTVALDCGMFQGKRQESAEKNRRLPLPIEDLDAVVLSHAHIDHSGRLPFLIAEGYSRTIWATSATRDLSAVMLTDSAHIQERDAEFLAKHKKGFIEPLYGIRHAVRTMELMVGVPYNKPFDVVPGVRATYVDAGHILGSASVILDCTESGKTKRLVFSGDIGRSGLAIVRDPTPPEGADALIMNTILGGSFTSRLNQNLREVKGYTYGASSRFDMRRAAGPFTAAAEIVSAKSDSALLEFMKELNGIRQAVPNDELSRAKRYLQLQLPGNFETTQQIAAALVPVALYGLPLDFYNNYVQSVEAVTQGDVARVAQQYINPGSLAIVIVGDRKTIEQGLKATNVGPISIRNMTGQVVQ